MRSLLVALLLIATWSQQANAIENKNRAWLGTFATKAIDENYSFTTETQLRYGIDEQGMNQVLFRGGILQRLSETQSLGYLYGYIETGSSKEHRLTIQHQLKMGTALDFEVSQRVRLEGRLLETVPENATRLRYQLRFVSASDLQTRPLIWNEVFVNLNQTNWNGNQTLDRNRFFLGLTRSFKDLRIELGYLNQFVPRSAFDTSEHTLVFYIFI